MTIVTATLDGFTHTINGGDQHITGTITQEAGAIWSFQFDILPTNEGYNLIQSRKTIIRAVNTITGRTEFAGRVLLAGEGMENTGLVSKPVTCESFLGYLQDSIQPFKKEAVYTLEEFIELVLNNHNEQVEPSKHIFLGKVNVEVAGTGNVYKGLQYETTFQTLKSKLVDVYGGELEIEEIDGVLYLNYLQQIGTTRATKIKCGRNMQAATREVSPLNIITRVIPLGAKLKKEVTDEDGNVTEEETEERLTLVGYTTPEGVTLSDPWIDDTEKIEHLGIICGTLDCSDITEQSNLYTRVKDFLKNDNFLELSHTLTALDLKENGQEIDGLYCGDSYPVENKFIGLNEVLRITKKSFDINAPYKGAITIGEKKTTFSKVQASKNRQILLQLQTLQKETQTLGNKSTGIIKKFETFATEITQTIESIVSQALASYVSISDLEAIKKDISTTITQTASDITMSFNNALTTLSTEIDGSITSLFTELNAYIRYYMNESGQPVIELGAENSNIIARLLNNRLSFLDNGIEVAYISDNRLYITNATIDTSLRIGNFLVQPRTSGNLSIV